MGNPSSAPVVPDTNNAPNYLVPCGVLTVIALGLCIARIWSRLRANARLLALRTERRLSPDDYLIAVATLTAVASYFVAIGSATHGWGHRSAYVSPSDRIIAFKCLVAQQTLGILCAGLVRISVAWSLLRFSLWKPWKWSLWIMMGVQVLVYIGLMLLMIGNCRPYRSLWEPVPKEELSCWDRKYSIVYGYVANVILIVTDFTLAMMPIHLLRHIDRPLQEKILVGVLMSLGLLATGIAGYKMTLSKKVYLGDTLSTTVELSLWNRLEMLVGIIAACMPCLKSTAERLLQEIGVLTDRFDISMLSFTKSSHKNESLRSSSGGSDAVDSVHIRIGSGKKTAESTPAGSTHENV